MKNSILNSAFILLLLIGASSCQKSNNTNSPAIFKSAIQKGNWKVTLYNKNGKEETAYFSEYNFHFASDGKAIATTSGIDLSGSWSCGTEDNLLKLYLNFGGSNPLQVINNDWHVVLQNATTIKLDDISGGNGATEILTFEKK